MRILTPNKASYKLSRTKLYTWIVILVALLTVGFLSSGAGKRSIEIGQDNNSGLLEKFSTPQCEHENSRPIAVMLSSDEEARPLSGISQADIVFEMPVTESGVTRMMAIYQCKRPEEIGSIRSARLDFIPLVQGLDSIYAHWGGEREALKQLNKGITDNIDGLKYDGTVYYRKSSIPRPHNGFTTYQNLIEKARDLEYKTTSEKISYEFEKGESVDVKSPPLLYDDGFGVLWDYNPETNAYERTRAGKPEIDKNTNEQVTAQNIIVMETSWSPINIDYIRVATIGSGKATLYKNGEIFKGTWKKPSAESMLNFYDLNGDEFTFTQGSIWIEIITNRTQ